MDGGALQTWAPWPTHMMAGVGTSSAHPMRGIGKRQETRDRKLCVWQGVCSTDALVIGYEPSGQA